jgi:hypothetical protein
MKNTLVPNPLVPLLFALWIIWGFGIETVGRRLAIELDGVVVSSLDHPSTGAPRYSTHYILRGPNGGDFSYVAGATDASLPRRLPVGTRLKKQKWHLDYEKNGQTIDDFPIALYAIVVGIGLALLLWSFLTFRDQRRARSRSLPA